MQQLGPTLHRITWLDTIVALALSAVVVAIATGLMQASGAPHGWAALPVVLMTAPVAWRRRMPLAAIGALAFGAVVNALLIGTYVRCGVALPALALGTYSAGAWLDRRRAFQGLALALVAGVTQTLSDPQLAGFTIGLSLLLGALWGAGRFAASRDVLLATLRDRTQELREQRDENARLAVAADRVQVAKNLDGMLGARIGRLAKNASGARRALRSNSPDAEAALVAIEREGRETLAEMRGIVGSLSEDSGHGPQPSLDDLETLLTRAASLTIAGQQRRLPAGLELSAYRIVERLIEPLESARAQVTIRYAPDALELAVRGTVRTDADLHDTLAKAREWVTLHAGTLESQVSAGTARTEARLPLVAAHA
jgi:hypothetical protein